MSTTNRSRFLRRFDRILAQARWVQLVQAVCWGILLALAGLGLLAAADYALELSHAVRLAGLSLVGTTALIVTIGLVAHSYRRWQRGATAATIEEVFPQLGQRIRTTVQYGEMSSDEIEHRGVATALVSALEDDTVKVAQPLPLDAVIPWKSLALASLLAAVLGIFLTGASAFDWQWRTAATRTFLGNEPYTLLKVLPGNAAVREGESLVINATVAGRSGESLQFSTRRLDEENAEWREETIPLSDAERLDDRTLAFELSLDRLRHPTEYRLAAGSAPAQTHQVHVLYPLKVVNVQATLQPPAYTGIGEQTTSSGNITGLIGTQAKLEIELDRVASSAWLEIQTTPQRRGETPEEPVKVPLTIAGTKLSTSLEITRDCTYAIVAASDDGMVLPDTKYRIRARHDEPPQVWFESPSEALEVHTLAEVLMRIRVSDDFGIARAGVVFEVNNEEEYPLLDEDFQKVVDAAQEVETTGQLSPKTRATLENVLPLEGFELTQQDSVMYYAFAEDIKPDSSQRTETDLRFIDIRPFRRLFRMSPDAEGMPTSGGPQLKSLEELVSRQRYALNRTIQMSKRYERSGQADLSGIDNLIKFEGELATNTRELALGLEAMGVDETELLYQAEAAMLSATDSLSAGSYDTATLQMRDALKNLIEGRNRLELFITKNRNRQLLAQLRQFDRLQQQKLRRPKSDEEEARELAKRLEQLADREDMLYQSIAGLMGQGKSGQGGEGEPMPTPQPSKEAQSTDKPADEADPMPDETDVASSADKESDDNPMDDDMPIAQADTPREIEDKQRDIGLEARELETALGKLPKATDLAKERIAGAAKLAEEAAMALGRGAMDEGQKSIGEARGEFRELAEQVRALLAEEQADRIAAAQQMAGELARRQQEFADRLATPGEGAGIGKPRKDANSSGMSEDEMQQESEERQAGLGMAAEEIAEKAETLQDVLGAAGKSENPEEQAAAEKIAALVGSLELSAALERLKSLPGQIGAGEMEDAKNNAGDGAERMESAAEQLAALHRTIVEPQVDELAKLEQEIIVLTDELDEIDTQTKVTSWHNDANDLLEELDKAGISEELREEFRDEMKKAGYGKSLDDKAGWIRTNGGLFSPPQPYRKVLLQLSSTVQARLQELMLGDLVHSGDEPVPPQYQELVDKYYEVLVRRSRK